MTYGRPGVYVTETLATAPVQSVGSTSAAAAVIGVFAEGPSVVPSAPVKSISEFTSLFGELSPLYPATIAVRQFFDNGGTELYVKRVLGANAGKASAALPATPSGTLATATALNKGSFGTTYSVAITANGGGTYNLAVYRQVTVGSSTTKKLVENYTNLVFNNRNASNFAGTVVNNSSAVLNLSSIDTTATPKTTSSETALTGSSLDGSAVVAADYIAALPADGTSEFSGIDRPLVIFAAGVYEKFLVDATTITEEVISDAIGDFADVCDQLTAWAASGNGFAVLDTVPGLSVGDALTFASNRDQISQAAVYYPNYFIQDTTSASPQATRKIGPAAAVVGNYLATDSSKGPFKAPAGINAKIKNAIALERSFSSVDLDQLNSGNSPVNAVRNLAGGNGIAIMGARTLLQDGTGNRYVNVRRSLIHIEKSINDLVQFALFANNDYKLWGQLTTVVNVFLNQYYNKGGLRGNSPKDAFYVKVDGTNNSPSDIQNGVVNIEVGVALEYPAEFIVLNIAQITGA